MDLNSSALDCLTPSLTLNAKPTQPRSLRNAWKRKPYLRHLSGLTCEPSAMRTSALIWKESRLGCCAGDTHARTSPSRVAGRVWKALAEAFGAASLKRLRRMNPNCVFSRTSQATLLSDSIPSSLIFERWATALRRDCSRRRKSAQATEGSDCSSWPTPNVPNGGRVVPEDARYTTTRCAYRTDGRKIQVGLEAAVKKLHCSRQPPEMWGTPNACTSAHNPRLVDHGVQLANQVAAWPTPAARDIRNAGGAEFLVRKRTESSRGQPLTEIAASEFSHQGQAISANGKKSSEPRRRLNPLFVEWLMGWPFGWSDYACSETALSLYKRRMRWRLWRLVCGEIER